MAKKKNETGGSPANPNNDEETQEILNEMEEDGVLEEEESEEESDREQEDSEDEEEEEEEEQDEDSDEDDAEENDSEQDEDEDESEEEEGDEDDPDEDTPKGRKARFIPAWQHKKELKQQEKRLRKELSGAAREASQSAEDVDEDSNEVREIVKKYGLPEDKGPEFVAAIINAAAKKAGKAIPSDALKKMQNAIADQEEERLFNREMKKTEPILRKLFPDAKRSDLDRIKKKLTRLAYTERYEKYSLADIATLNSEKLKPKEKKKTGESSGGKGAAKTKATKRYNLNEPDSIPWADLDDETFDELSAELEKQSGSGLKVRKKGGR